MKVALTVWDGRISPVFDVCREALILEIDKGKIASATQENLDNATTLQKIERLMARGVGTLVCGAITESARNELTARGLRVIGFVAGEIDEVVPALVSGGLPAPSLSMPGCYGRQRRFRGGRGQGCGRGQRRGRNRR